MMEITGLRPENFIHGIRAYLIGLYCKRIVSDILVQQDNLLRERGKRFYELTNHLGNVLSTVTDRKLPISDTIPTPDTVLYFNADIATATDYYPFGMQMVNRTYSLEDYRFGFNGKEEDTSGMGGGQSTHDYGFRIYNPHIGKFLSVDPLTQSFPWNSTYCYAENDVIRSIDLDGTEKKVQIYSSTAACNIINKIEQGDYKVAWEKIIYCYTHGWVDNEGNPSDFVHRHYEELYGENQIWQIPKVSSALIFPNSTDLPGDEDKHDNNYSAKYGNYSSGGGWFEIYYFDYEKQESYFLGVIPNAKIRENQEMETYSVKDPQFQSVTPTYEFSDYMIGKRLRIAGYDVTMFLMKKSMPWSLSWDQQETLKKQKELRARLRTLGPNSRVLGSYEEFGAKGSYIYTYTVDEKGNEDFQFQTIVYPTNIINRYNGTN
jgi:RHS repeat-associated protein